MTDLSEFYADSPLRASLVKKRQAEQLKLDKINAKAAPIIITIEMYDDMIATIDKRNTALKAHEAFSLVAESSEEEIAAAIGQAQHGEEKTAAEVGSGAGTELPVEE